MSAYSPVYSSRQELESKQADDITAVFTVSIRPAVDKQSLFAFTFSCASVVSDQKKPRVRAF